MLDCSQCWASTLIPCGDFNMIVGLIYAAAALGVAVYMVVALLRPEKF